jgi:HK97 family phage major capsid protein
MTLSEQRAKIVADWRAMLDAADAEKRALSPEELEKSKKMEADIDALKKTIDARAKADAADRAIVPDSQRTTTADKKDDKAAYRDAFWHGVRTGEVRADLKVGTDSLGGYTVPDEFRKELIVALEEENVIRGLATSFVTTSGIMTIPVNSAHGSAAWGNEESSYSTSDETFSEVTLSAYKGKALIKVSEELLHDSAFPIDSFLAKEFGRRLGKLEEEAFINGTGSGQPTGIVGGSTLGTTATATNAITADELTDLYHSIARPYRARATWIMKDSTIKLIRKLKTGVSSDNTYLWQAGLKDGEPDRLFGRPVVPSEFMPAATTGLKPVIFGDISYYYIGDRQAMSMQRLVELYAANGQVGFRQFKRTDGKLALATAVNHLLMA